MTALYVMPAALVFFRYSDWLRLEVTPKLHHVRSTRIVPSPSSA